ncbi:TPA: hypothetical protein ACFOZO_000677 [Neisseria meningitidis]
MPDRIKPSRNGGGADDIARPHQTKPKRRRCRRHSPTARHGADGRETRNITDREVRGFFAPVAGGDWI